MSNTKSNEKNAARNLGGKLTLNKEVLGQSIADSDLVGVAGMSGGGLKNREVMDRTTTGATNSDEPPGAGALVGH